MTPRLLIHSTYINIFIFVSMFFNKLSQISQKHRLSHGLATATLTPLHLWVLGLWREGGGKASRYASCNVARGCTLPLRAYRGRVHLHLQSLATNINTVPLGSVSGCQHTIFRHCHSPCFLWVFHEGPRGTQAGCEVRGGRCQGAPLSQSEIRAQCTRVWVHVCMCVCMARVWPLNWQA